MLTLADQLLFEDIDNIWNVVLFDATEVHNPTYQHYEREAFLSFNTEEQQQLQSLPMAVANGSMVIFAIEEKQYAVAEVEDQEEQRIHLLLYTTTTTHGEHTWFPSRQPISVPRNSIIVPNVTLTKKKKIPRRYFVRIPTDFECFVT